MLNELSARSLTTVRWPRIVQMSRRGSSHMKKPTAAIALLMLVSSTAAFAGVQKSTVKPRGDPSSWVLEEDASSSTLQLGGGTATVEYGINALGRAENCRVIKPASNNPRIGETICRNILRRARYMAGPGTGTYTMGWAD